MTTSPFEPDPRIGEERIAAADAGQGAPGPAEGFGPEAAEPDKIEPADGEEIDPDPAGPELGDG
ncbi:hypothetical protein ACFWIW_24545 [Amycolatopsis sp. NPDC058340]|uniref:hypothetical protein n=1 Tax=Amycolatopsis sp. NPDC058340 TaxID=3346453 RepID=UPI0036643E58